MKIFVGEILTMSELKKLYTIVFPSVIELAEFKITTNTSWDAIDVEHCSITTKLLEKDLPLVKLYGGKLFYNSMDNHTARTS